MDCGNESVESSSQVSSGRNFWNWLNFSGIIVLTAGEKSVYRTWFAKNEARCMILVFWGHTFYVAGLYFSILRSKCHPFVSSISPDSHQHSLVFYFNFLLQFIDSAVYTFEERFKELVPSTDGMTNGQTAATLMEQAREEVLMVS